MSNNNADQVLRLATSVVNATSGATTNSVEGRSYEVGKTSGEKTVVGVELENFIKRVPSEDGLYVVVTEHSEHIESVPQPLTPEELAIKREESRFRAKLVAAVAGVGLAVAGVLFYVDTKRPKIVEVRPEPLRAVEDAS